MITLSGGKLSNLFTEGTVQYVTDARHKYAATLLGWPPGPSCVLEYDPSECSVYAELTIDI